MNKENINVTTTVSYNTRRYHERKNKGLCVKCGSTVIDGQVYCLECRMCRNEEARQNRIFYREQGLCTYCGRNRVFKNEHLCPEWRAKAANWQAQRKKTDKERDRHNARRRKHYWERSAQGICTACGKRKAVPGKKMCGICAGKKAEDQRIKHIPAAIPRAERYLHGLCSICSNSLDMANMKVCSRCYENLKRARKTSHIWKQYNTVIFKSRIALEQSEITV